MMCDLVIFDCDGVLVDSEHLVIELEAELFGSLGVALTSDEIAEQFVGLSDEEMHRRIEEQWDVTLPASFGAQKADAVRRALDERLEPVAGMSDLLADLTTDRCVASSSAPDRIERSLARTNLLQHFHPHLYSASMVARGKPAPDLFLHAAAAMGASPTRCLVIEDSPHGVEAAVAAGMTAIGFVGGRHCRPALGPRLAEAGADTVVATSRELARRLRTSGST